MVSCKAGVSGSSERRSKVFTREYVKLIQSVSVADNAFAFDVVQNLANFGGRALAMIEKRNKISNGALEIDVVFPKCVVRVDQQSLRRRRMPAHKNMILRSALRHRGTTAEKSKENVC